MANQITPNPSVPTQIVNDGLKFPKFVTNLGIIPTSYKDSMSYYECLAWLCKYLEETVIPTVNQNGEAVEELQALYIELNEYVTNYFDTLDVQEEINNKLDDMVEQGTLQEIISEYLNSIAIFGFDNIEGMKESSNLINGSYAKTMGYYSKNDGGSGLYKIRSRTFDDVIDNGSIILMDNENLIAELIYSGYVTPEQFGAHGDGTTDDSTAFKNALSFCKNLILSKNKTYFINHEIPLNGNENIDLNGSKIKFTTGTETTDIDSCFRANGKNITIKNGTIEEYNVISRGTGADNVPICIGNYNTSEIIDTENIILSNLKILTSHTNGNGISIFGNAHNVIVDNIYVDGNNASLSGILIHWCQNNSNEKRYSPYNVKITNSLIENCVDTAIFMSCVHNITLDNCKFENTNNGFRVYPGDYGFDNNENGITRMSGINIKSCVGLNLKQWGFKIEGKGSNTSNYYPIDINVSNDCFFKSSTNRNNNNHGFQIENFPIDSIDNLSNIQIGGIYDGFKNCTISHANAHINDMKLVNQIDQSAFTISNSKHVIIENSQILPSILSSTLANTYKFMITTSEDITLKNNIISSENENATTKFGVRINDTTSKNFIFSENKFLGQTYPISVSSGSAGLTQNYIARDNFLPDDASAQISGAFPFAQTGLNKQYYSGGTPADGNHFKGEIVWNTNPGATGYIGWVCVTAGTPGTWKGFGTIAS